MTELVSLAGGEAGDVDRHLHELLLEERHAEGLGEALLEEWVEVGDLLLPVASPDVGMDRATLDRAGTDERDFDDEVVERGRLHPRQGRHLGAAIDLEHTNRVGFAERGVDGRVLLRERGELPAVAMVFAHEVDHQGEEHPEAEQVELDQPGSRAVVLVPLERGAVLHPAPLDRAHIDDRSVAHDHPARVDAEVAREVLDFSREGEHLVRDLAAAAVGSGQGDVAVELLDQASTWPWEVPHDEEVAGEPELLDDLQLVVDLGPAGTGMERSNRLGIYHR